MNGSQDIAEIQNDLIIAVEESTTTSTKFTGFGIIDVIILLVCFAILIIMIVLGSIYCKRRKELVMKKKKKKIATDNTNDKEKAININNVVDQVKDKEESDLTNVSNQVHKDNEDEKRNSEKIFKNTFNSTTHYNDNTVTNLNTNNLNTNSQLKIEQSNQHAKLLIFKDATFESAKSGSRGSVVKSTAKTNQELLKSEDISSSHRSIKNDKKEKSHNNNNDDFLNFNDVELSSIKFNVNSKKRRPKEIPNGKVEKKVTKESGVLKDFESFKNSNFRNLSQPESAKINTSKEYTNSLNSKDNRNILFKNILDVDNNKIVSESEEDEDIDVPSRKKDDFQKHGQTLINTFKKYEDNVLDSLAHKEKYLYCDDDLNIIGSGTGMDSKNKESKKSNNENSLRNKLEMARLEAQKKKGIVDKPINKNSLKEEPKIDIMSLKNKNLFAKDNNNIKIKHFPPLNFKEDKMSAEQHSDFMDD